MSQETVSHTLFISDVHLCARQRRVSSAFVEFVQQQAIHAEALYILGDLFEYWAGDDDLDTAFHRKICAALRDLSGSGTRLFIMRGNRDFLMDQALATASGAELIDDPSVVQLYGNRVLLTHGDALCTDDADYQAFRKRVRESEWQKQFLAQPLSDRKQQIEKMRAESKMQKQRKELHIMDVNTEAVCALLREQGYPVIIHGHTHRPAHHLIHLDDYTCHRWVLGEWDKSARILQADAQGFHFRTIG